ncbi:Nuclear receptor-binding protein homolog [Strongyloides ratti]|uniref:Nuclear receptor-binding protein homolog n=1 Tax=Strongyloides ratti TaxID=34506 RepID=A0A090LE53_STRRB|nr:Nuclear receptor-binding protein homolog [Strongyloides ratti]CEF68066.1 Nuclear receptor-binding protein homolog [Strongyloides ratti]
MQNVSFKDSKSSLTISSNVSHEKPKDKVVYTNNLNALDVGVSLNTKDVKENTTDSIINLSNKSTTTGETSLNSIKARLGYDSETSESETDDNNVDIVEESPNGRWVKRTEKVNQRDIPGNEVVWNEVLFSGCKNFKQKQHIIRQIFDNLAQLRHANLVRFHDHWTDGTEEKPRIVFITEYMSSGCMARFLHRTRVLNNSGLSIKSWKAWCTQILSALNYLHSCLPSVVHGNLNINTIFFQQNGKIKIGGVTPHDVKLMLNSLQNNVKYLHYLSPEYHQNKESTIESDIYSFGICALEMAIHKGLIDFARSLNPDISTPVIDQEVIQKALDQLEDEQQKDFIKSCLKENPKERESVRKLLFHPILFKIHQLKLLAAHKIVKLHLNEDLPSEYFQIVDPDRIAATSKFREMSYGDVAACQQDLEKFIKDVKNDVYPMTTFPTFEQPTKLKKIVFELDCFPENNYNSEDNDDTRSTEGLNISSPRPSSSKTSNSPSARDVVSPESIHSKGLDSCGSRPMSPDSQISPCNTVKSGLVSDISAVSKSKFSIERFSTEPSPPPTMHKAASQPPEIIDNSSTDVMPGVNNIHFELGEKVIDFSNSTDSLNSTLRSPEKESDVKNNEVNANFDRGVEITSKDTSSLSSETKKNLNVSKVLDNVNPSTESQNVKVNTILLPEMKPSESEPKKKQFVVIKVSTKTDNAVTDDSRLAVGGDKFNNKDNVEISKKKIFDISRVKEENSILENNSSSCNQIIQGETFINNMNDEKNLSLNNESSNSVTKSRFTLIKGSDFPSLDFDQGILENSDLSCQEEINEIRENLLKLQQMNDRDSEDDDDLKTLEFSGKGISRNIDEQNVGETNISSKRMSFEENKDHRSKILHGENSTRSVINVDNSQSLDITDSEGDSRSSSPTHKVIDDSLIIKKVNVSIDGTAVFISIRLSNNMVRNLKTSITNEDNSNSLISSLVEEGFIRKCDAAQFMMIFSLLLEDFDLEGKRSISWLNDMESGGKITLNSV